MIDVEVFHDHACRATATRTMGKPMNVFGAKRSEPSHQPTNSATGGFA